MRCQWVQTSFPTVSSVACFAVNGSNLFAGTSDVNGPTGGGVFRSSDDGTTWMDVSIASSKYGVEALAVSGSNLFAGTDSGVFVSEDNGLSWKPVNNGLTNDTVYALLASGTNLFAGTWGGGVFRSTDNGTSWTTINNGLTQTNVISLAMYGTTLLAGAGNNDGSGGVFLSTDNGTTWNDTYLPSTSVYSFAASGTNLYVGTYSGVYLSTDTGSSWSLPLTSYMTQALAVSGTKLFGGTFGGGVSLSTDDGSSWTLVNTGFSGAQNVSRIRALVVSGANLYASGANLVAGSSDTGSGVWRRPLADFDPANGPVVGTWSTAASSGFTGRFVAASSVVGGKIYVMGGYGDGYILTDVLDVFDPSANSWTVPLTSGTFTPRGGLSSAEVDGKIYVMGGGVGATTASKEVNVLEVFDPSTNAWSAPTTTGSFTARVLHTSAVVNGKIYVMGGCDGAATNYINNLEVFDPSTNEWNSPKVSGTFSPRYGLTSCVINNKIYAFGGRYNQDVLNTLEVFDPATNTWSTPTTTGGATARRGATSSVIDGKMYIFGGSGIGGGLNTVEMFDPATNAWSTPSQAGICRPGTRLLRALLAPSAM